MPFAHQGSSPLAHRSLHAAKHHLSPKEERRRISISIEMIGKNQEKLLHRMRPITIRAQGLCIRLHLFRTISGKELLHIRSIIKQHLQIPPCRLLFPQLVRKKRHGQRKARLLRPMILFEDLLRRFFLLKIRINMNDIIIQNAIMQPSLQVFLPIMSNRNLMLNLLTLRTYFLHGNHPSTHLHFRKRDFDEDIVPALHTGRALLCRLFQQRC